MNIMDGLGLGQWLHRSGVDESERKLDEQIEDSFPASDPPSFCPSFTTRGRSRAGIGRQANRTRGSNSANENPLH